MKKTRRTKPTANKLSILHQLCNYIPGHLVVNLARKHGVDKKARSFTPWSHVVSMLYAQLTHSIGLNDVCDALGHHRGALSSIRGAEAPSRSGLSYANKHRDAKMAESCSGRCSVICNHCPQDLQDGHSKGFLDVSSEPLTWWTQPL